MPASSSYTFKYGDLPSGALVPSSSHTVKYGDLPSGAFRPSSSHTLEVDYNIDGDNTIQFTTDATAMVMSPADIFVDADSTVEFGTTDTTTNPAVIVNAENTVEFPLDATEMATLGVSGQNTVQFDPQATEVATFDISAESTVEFAAFTNSVYLVDAESTVSFDTEAEVPPEIDMSKIVIHGATWHRKNNISGPQGGPINFRRKMATGPIPALSTVALMSSAPDDTTQIYQIEGLGPTRAIIKEQVLLTGSFPVYTVNTFSRLCRITKESGDPLVGNITVFSGNSILGMMESAADSGTGLEIEELTNFLANTMGRATVDSAFYEKFFIWNGTGRVINRLEVTEHQSDFKERVLFAADTGYDDDSTSRNRLTKPGDVPPGNFLTDDKLVFTNVPIGAAIGIWLRLLIPAGEGTVLNGWKIKLDADGFVSIVDLLHPEGSGRTGELIFSERDLHPIGGGNPLRWIELKGGRFVPQQYWPPDPATFRSEFYYNTRLNQLFKRIKTLPVPVWKLVR